MIDEKIWKSIIPRVKKKLNLERRPYHTTLFYSIDMDQYLDADNPVENPTTTVREELRKMGIKSFIRLPDSTGLSNYLEVDYTQKSFLS